MTTEIVRDALGIIVRNEGEYGAFFVRETARMLKPHDWRYSCELTVQSSFGTVGHYWSHMGSPAHRFFDLDQKSYFLGKLFGDKTYEFDAKNTVRQLKKMLINDRREREVDSDLAREIWEALGDLDEFDNLEVFYDRYTEYPELMDWTTPGDIPSCQQITSQAEGFWKQLWPEFVQAMKDEAARPRDIS